MCACVCELPVYSRWPSKSTVPSSGRSSPASVYSKVVLPAPEAPTRKTASLRCTSIEMPRNTSIRRGPMRNERRRSCATNCGAPFFIARTLPRQFKPGNQARDVLAHAAGSNSMLKMAARPHWFLASPAERPLHLFRPPLINKSKRSQRRPIDRASHRQVILHLVILNRRSRYRTEHTIDSFTEVSELLQRILHVGDDLVWWQTVITVDGPIVSVVGIVGIVAVSRIPVTQVPRVKPAAD